MHWLRLKRTRALILAAGLSFAGSASAGLAFAPTLNQFGRVGAGTYALLGFAAVNSNQFYGPDGELQEAVGSSADIQTVSFAMAWADNWFRYSDVPWLKDTAQSCAFSVGAAHIQGRGDLLTTTAELGLNGGANQVGDLFGTCAIQDKTRRIGPVKGHLQFSGLVKLPTGSYDTDNLYNYGTRYFMVAPQLSAHLEWGRWIMDGTLVHQFNSDTDSTATAGLTPNGIADWHNAALNLGVRLNARWAVDVGYSYNASVGSNRYDKVNVASKNAIPANSLCAPLALDDAACNTTTLFYFQSRPGPYQDSGAMVRLATVSIYYVYRSSMALGFRVLRPIAGRSGGFNPVLDLCVSKPCGPENATQQFSIPTGGAGDAAAAGSGTVFSLSAAFPLGAP